MNTGTSVPVVRFQRAQLLANRRHASECPVDGHRLLPGGPDPREEVAAVGVAVHQGLRQPVEQVHEILAPLPQAPGASTQVFGPATP
jgi:hypothetical protein